MITIFALLPVFALSVAPGATDSLKPSVDDKPLIFGVFPRRSPSDTMKLFKPIAEQLSTALGRPVRVATSVNFKAYWNNLRNGRYDLVHCNQYHYLMAHKNYGFDAVASIVEHGNTTLAGTVVVEKDSKVNDVSDLRGQTIVFGGGPKAMQSFIIPRYLLSKAGLHPKDYTTIFSPTPPRAIDFVLRGKALAAGVGDAVIPIVVRKKKLEPDRLRVLVTGPSLPHLPMAVHKSLGQPLMERIRQILVHLHESPAGLRALQHAKLDAFQARSDSDYDQHRDIVRAALDETW